MVAHSTDILCLGGFAPIVAKQGGLNEFVGILPRALSRTKNKLLFISSVAVDAISVYKFLYLVIYWLFVSSLLGFWLYDNRRIANEAKKSYLV